MHTYYSNKSSVLNILRELAIIRNSSIIGLIAVCAAQMYCRFSNDKVIFQTFWSVNAFSYEFCCESELPNNLVDLAEAAFQQIQQMKLLSSAVSEETFCKYIGFHKAVKVLKYSPKCVFNDTSKCFLIYFEVSVFAVKYRAMFCSTPITQAKWEGSQPGFVCKQQLKRQAPSNPSENRKGAGKAST